MSAQGNPVLVGPFQQFPDPALAAAQGAQGGNVVPQAIPVVQPQPAPVYMPPRPKMGGLVQTTNTEHVAWTGGLPMADWSRLDPAAPTMTQSPNQYRPSQVAASQKAYNFHITGITPALSKGSHFESFKDDFWEALIDRGLDTIAYVPDIATQSVMYSVVQDSPRFTFNTIKTSIAPQLAEYDACDHANDKCAKIFFLNSISKELLLVLHLRIKESDPFPVVWMLLLGLVQPHGVTHFEQLKEKIRSRTAIQ